MTIALRLTMLARSIKESLNGGKARRRKEWEAMIAKTEATRLNRSNGAKKGWATRRAKANGSAPIVMSAVTNSADLSITSLGSIGITATGEPQ